MLGPHSGSNGSTNNSPNGISINISHGKALGTPDSSAHWKRLAQHDPDRLAHSCSDPRSHGVSIFFHDIAVHVSHRLADVGPERIALTTCNPPADGFAHRRGLCGRGFEW
jgi:hypothetical protein